MPYKGLTCKPCRERTGGRGEVEVAGALGDAIVCRCRSCGYEYRAYSKAARRRWRADNLLASTDTPTGPEDAP